MCLSPLLGNGLTLRLLGGEAVSAGGEIINLLAAQPSLADAAGELVALPRRAAVLPAHVALREGPHLAVVKDANVGVHALLDGTLTVGEADLLGGSLAAQANNVGQSRDLGRRGAGLGCGVEDGQAEANGGDAAPSRKEVALCAGLLLGCRVLLEMLREQLQLRCAG